MLDIVHLFRFSHITKDIQKIGWYRRIPNDIGYSYDDHILAIFLIPRYAMMATGTIQKWHWADKMPKIGMHLSAIPIRKIKRTQNLLQATRGLLLYTDTYDPAWFRKPEDAAYFIGYNQMKFLHYYDPNTIIQHCIFRNRPPAEYIKGYEDATFKI